MGGEEESIHLFLDQLDLLLKTKKAKGTKAACAILHERLGPKPKNALGMLDPADRMDFDKNVAMLIKSYDDKGHVQECKRKFKSMKQGHEETFRQLLNRLITLRRRGWPCRPGPGESYESRKSIVLAFFGALTNREVANRVDYCFISQMKEEQQNTFENLLDACENYLEASVKKNKLQKNKEAAPPIKFCKTCKKTGHEENECRNNPNRTGIATKPVKALDIDDIADMKLTPEQVLAIEGMMDGMQYVQCFACNLYGHFANACPNKEQVQREARKTFGDRISAAAAGRPLPNPQGQRAPFNNPTRQPAPYTQKFTGRAITQEEHALLYPGSAPVPPFTTPAGQHTKFATPAGGAQRYAGANRQFRGPYNPNYAKANQQNRAAAAEQQAPKTEPVSPEVLAILAEQLENLQCCADKQTPEFEKDFADTLGIIKDMGAADPDNQDLYNLEAMDDEAVVDTKNS
jgi:hypothetical protein